jgi:hypothetical protein
VERRIIARATYHLKKRARGLTSKARDSKKWEEDKKREKRSEASFVKSSTRACPLWEPRVLAFLSTKKAEDAGNSRCQ